MSCGSPDETALQHLLEQKMLLPGAGGTTEAALNLASPDVRLPSWLLPAGLFICTERTTGANLSNALGLNR